ncbi:MAG TPA: pyridoxamine 5'-phosphate oxidase family protein [Mycobacteriales bacterium]|jgi:hypothetical protein|nr:pyridoxamine 5'-phosphate oxidase family protein [Mycobacteriales bacterium]
MTRSTEFHEGELAVQRRAGVRAEAARLSGMLAPPNLSGGAHIFLGERDLALLTGRDRGGRLWISPILGTPGFLDGRDTTLRVHSRPSAGDPLHDLPIGQPVGMLAIDFGTRRRMRVNGTLTAAGSDGLEMAVDQAYGNCPQYIQQRHLRRDGIAAAQFHAADFGDAEQTRMIEQSDTFFLGTVHPERGADASHRGGTPGFVRVDGTSLWWPDYPGNNMFNSLGNIAIDDTTALLFLDFATGGTLHLSGTAAVEWTAPGARGDDGGTGRRTRFTPQHVVAGAALPFRAADLIPYRRNPHLTD